MAQNPGPRARARPDNQTNLRQPSPAARPSILEGSLHPSTLRNYGQKAPSGQGFGCLVRISAVGHPIPIVDTDPFWELGRREAALRACTTRPGQSLPRAPRRTDPVDSGCALLHKDVGITYIPERALRILNPYGPGSHPASQPGRP